MDYTILPSPGSVGPRWQFHDHLSVDDDRNRLTPTTAPGETYIYDRSVLLTGSPLTDQRWLVQRLAFVISAPTGIAYREPVAIYMLDQYDTDPRPGPALYKSDPAALIAMTGATWTQVFNIAGGFLVELNQPAPIIVPAGRRLAFEITAGIKPNSDGSRTPWTTGYRMQGALLLPT